MKHKIRSVHFVGIGGAGMSGIAEVLLNLGYEVSGSDAVHNAATRRLAGLGARVWQGHEESHVVGADVVVSSTAVPEENPELRAARAAHIPVVPRAMMLAELMRLKQGIAVAGTHGKTTTTSLVASVLAEAGMDPTFVIGGKLNSVGTHAALGTGEFIVVEADESDGSFLFLQPMIAVVTNIDRDHMETYGHDFARLQEAFLQFLDHLPFYGLAVLCIDDPVVRNLVNQVGKPVMTYGFCIEAQVRAVDVQALGDGMRFGVELRPGRKGILERRLEVTLNLPGRHNVLNALAAIAVALEVGASYPSIVRALSQFKGVGRRFQRYGELPLPQGGAVALVDDYGHHPVEMEATLSAARGAYPGRRIILVFQPHRYSRTRDCFQEFVQVLAQADEIYLAPVYAAGERTLPEADSGALLAALIRLAGSRAQGVWEVDQMAEQIVLRVQSGDVVLVMGAGNISQVPGQLVASLGGVGET
ncbi:MAG: UDP-N-acetylmuramate--L-alanine ligase [Ferrovum sp.]|nr:UDP-N-acetylmuramate--L-alanine ligase [Ferrovum sp.]NDU86973.1 UDP-N-acetylmuramate--L-alanine ligase [Ferrovum sp.]